MSYELLLAYISRCSDHSQKRKDSLETRAVLKEMSMLSCNLTSGPKHRGSLLKNMALSEGNRLFAGDFHAFLDEINAGMLQFTHKWNWKWIV